MSYFGRFTHMMVIMRLFALLIILLVATACDDNPNVDIENPGASCPTTAAAIGNDLIIPINPTEKLSNRFAINGTQQTNGQTLFFPLQSLTLYLGSTNLTEIRVELYEFEGSVVPDSGTLLSTAIVMLDGSTATDVNIPTLLTFPTAVNLRVGPTYYFIVSATGGSFDIAKNTEEADRLVSTQLSFFDGASWTIAQTNNENIATTMTYGECFFQ